MSFSITNEAVFLLFPEPQYQAIFLGRPQRFLADVHFRGGANELAYCPNSGAMSGCLVAGSEALVWDSANSKRTRRYTLRAVELDGVWVGTDTHLANRIVEEALKLKLVPGLETYELRAREYQLEKGVRIDFLLGGAASDCLVEVKSAIVVEKGVARYPDSVTPRGVRQLKVLTSQAVLGRRVVLLFLVQRADAHSFVVSRSFDPVYASAFEEAIAAGVEVLTLGVTVSQAGFSSPRLLPYGENVFKAVETN